MYNSPEYDNLRMTTSVNVGSVLQAPHILAIYEATHNPQLFQPMGGCDD